MDLQPDSKRFEELAEQINSDSSPVGIDARKTHVLILHQLELLHNRLDRLEEALLK